MFRKDFRPEWECKHSAYGQAAALLHNCCGSAGAGAVAVGPWTSWNPGSCTTLGTWPGLCECLWGVKVYQHIVNVVGLLLSDNSGSYLFMAQLALWAKCVLSHNPDWTLLEEHLWPEFERNPDSLAAASQCYRIFFCRSGAPLFWDLDMYTCCKQQP